jgi:hypothetical protein
MSARYVRGFCAAVIAVAVLIGAAAASPAKAADHPPVSHSGGSIVSVHG